MRPIERLTDWRPELVLLTSWGDELDVVIDKYQEEKGPKHRALGHPAFYGTYAFE